MVWRRLTARQRAMARAAQKSRRPSASVPRLNMFTKRKIMGNNIYSFKRTCEKATYTIGDGAVSNYALTFKLNDLPNYTEFTSLFDSYRICAVKLQFVYTATGSDTGVGNAYYWTPWFHSVVDHDDAVALSSIDDYLQYESYKVAKLAGKNIKRFIKPKVSSEIYTSGGTAFAEENRNKWIDSASPGCEHFGYKFMIDTSELGGAGTHTVGKLMLLATYYLQFKEVR